MKFEDFRDDYWQTRIYPGNYLIFYDEKTGKTFSPFRAKPNICYGETIFNNGFFYFTQVNIEANELKIFKYYPEQEAEIIFTCSLSAVNLHNLTLMPCDNGVQLVSDTDQGPNTENYSVKGYFPEKFTLTCTESQLPLFIKNHQMYFNDYEVHYNDNDDFVKYVYYTCSKNLNNKLISKERGLYTLAPNGKWWLS